MKYLALLLLWLGLCCACAQCNLTNFWTDQQLTNGMQITTVPFCISCSSNDMIPLIIRMTDVDTPTGHATASSTYSGTFDPFKPFEPIVPEASAQNWLASDDTFPQWLQHDQTNTSVAKMTVLRNGTAGYRLSATLYGIDGLVTNVLASGIIMGSNSVLETLPSIVTNVFENSTAYSSYKWKFDVTEQAGAHNISIMFVQLYGCP